MFKNTVTEEAGTAPPHRDSFACATDRIADDGFGGAMNDHLGDELRRHVGWGDRYSVVPERGVWKGARREAYERKERKDTKSQDSIFLAALRTYPIWKIQFPIWILLEAVILSITARNFLLVGGL